MESRGGRPRVLVATWGQAAVAVAGASPFAFVLSTKGPRGRL